MLFVGIGIVIFLIFSFYQKNKVASQYSNAIKFISEKEYDKAIDILKELKDYKDGEKLLSEARIGKKYEKAISLYKEKRYQEAIEIFSKLGDYQDCKSYILEAKYQSAIQLFKENKTTKSKQIFNELDDYKDSSLYLAKIEIAELDHTKTIIYKEALKLYHDENYEDALENFLSIDDYKDSQQLASDCAEKIMRTQHAKTIAAGIRYSMGITQDGKVLTAGANENHRCDVTSWENIVSIAGMGNLTIGLLNDGTVKVAGQLYENKQVDVSNWENIVSIAAGEQYVIGLKEDGTVIGDGHDGDGQIDVEKWNNVISIDTGWRFTVALTEEGDLLFAGYENGQKKQFLSNKSQWKDVVSIAAGGGGKGEKCKGKGHTVGLKSDGTVVAIGDNSYGQCNVSDWRDIVEIDAGDWYTVGLKKDGTVLITGENTSHNAYIDDDIYTWKDIKSIAAGFGQTLGLTSDGTVVAIGYNNDNERDGVKNWKNIKCK